MPQCPNCNAEVDANTSFTDPRDGQTYKTVKIGNQVWLAENFRYNCDGSYAYDDDKKNVKSYGRLYTWEAAMNCAPKGWHLPTKEEFDQLESWVDAHTDGAVGTALKSTTDDWKDDEEYEDYEDTPKGTDEFGFCALPAGFRYNNGDFSSLVDRALFWSASDDEIGSDHAYYRGLYCLDEVFHEFWGFKENAFSIRLVRD